MLRTAWFVALGVAVAGRAREDEHPPVTVHASLGTFDDGSGRAGFAALTAIRDDGGEAPARAFTLILRHDGEALDGTATYAAYAPWALSV